MKLNLACDAHLHSNFIPVDCAQRIANEITKKFDLNAPEQIQFPDGRVLSIWPWKMNFLSPHLYQSKKFLSHHGRSTLAFDELLGVMHAVNKLLGTEFDVCVGLYYPNGDEYIDFHSDLPAFGPTDTIASLSIGATRNFIIRDGGSKEEVLTLELESCSLLVMGEGFQDIYEHALQKNERICSDRFNFSFRKFQFSKS
ncbi:alpha-ketoglutarate-dependent dioxygenase AlkB [Pseudoalteromonas xiamenensis]|uniref:alpha-ketoglutarate-dependent dioxygenase AlkB n=1 Tax=Pseudoalteromonas xiamenensis TaxID=882626 RepID=UPI0027E56F9B|nr:alpha-ketoglutarate-dependent dioxygenase AlkB [Pseudoalteromonas xiamenensis]WMN59033.1 alpha-ketoglutarate-dependent dioxygenase AlkB [Pseudoalteromonas xiamenensis]